MGPWAPPDLPTYTWSRAEVQEQLSNENKVELFLSRLLGKGPNNRMCTGCCQAGRDGCQTAAWRAAEASAAPLPVLGAAVPGLLGFLQVPSGRSSQGRRALTLEICGHGLGRQEMG